MSDDDSRRRFPKDQRLFRVHLQRLLIAPDQRDAKPYAIPKSVARWTAKKVREGMSARYDASVVDGQVQVQTVPAPHGVGVWSAMALLFLLDHERPYRVALRRCALPSCGKWFMALGRGMGKKEYCPAGCYKVNDKANAVIRAQAARRDMTIEEFRGSTKRRAARHK
jgi:hypothetical protein